MKRIKFSSKLRNYELLSQKIYKILKEAIIKQDLPPGAKLRETQIANELGVSRTPVREAIRRLSIEGFVEITPNQNSIVKDLSLEDLIDILKIREYLEGLSVNLACNNITEKDVKKFESILENMKTQIEKHNLKRFSSLDDRFHTYILKISKNKRLIQMMEIINDQIRRFRFESLALPGRLEESFKEHVEIFNAIKERDGEKAEKLMRKHINNVLKNIMDHKFKARKE